MVGSEVICWDSEVGGDPRTWSLESAEVSDEIVDLYCDQSVPL